MKIRPDLLSQRFYLQPAAPTILGHSVCEKVKICVKSSHIKEGSVRCRPSVWITGVDYWHNSQMGFRELGFSLLISVFLINLASSYPTRKTLPSEFMQKSKIEDKRINGSKIEGASNHGVPHGGNSHGNGNGDSGSHHSPNTQGGGAVMPVIVGGAASNNRNRRIHHGAANSNLNRISFSTRLMITLVYLLILLFS